MLKATMSRLNTDGNRHFGYICDATVTIKDVENNYQVVTTISGVGQTAAIARQNFWADWKNECKERFEKSIYLECDG